MTIVILAAGAARRMGTQKLLLPIDGRPMLGRVIDAAAGWPIVVVASAAVAAHIGGADLERVINDEPQRGMAHSLQLANDRIDACEPIAVVLGDLPDISAHIIERAVRAYDDTIDVVVPRCGETFAHPVVFGPRARKMIAALPAGDSIKRLRDHPALIRRFVETEAAAFTDIDTPGDYARRLAASESSQ